MKSEYANLESVKNASIDWILGTVNDLFLHVTFVTDMEQIGNRCLNVGMYAMRRS